MTLDPPPTNALAPIVVDADHPGQLLKIEDHLVQGRYNAVYYYADNDPISKMTDSAINHYAQYPDIAIIKVNVGSLDSPLAKAYRVFRLPMLIWTDSMETGLRPNPWEMGFAPLCRIRTCSLASESILDSERRKP